MSEQNEENWLELHDLLIEIALLQIEQSAVVRRVAKDKFTIRFQKEMTLKQARQHEYDRFWVQY